jgi:hypothetical protein
MRGGRRPVLEAPNDGLTTTDYLESTMAKKHYSADSVPLPLSQPPSGMGLLKALYVPAPSLTDELLTIKTYVLTAEPYIGENLDLARRLQEHVSVRQNASPSGGTPTSISID